MNLEQTIKALQKLRRSDRDHLPVWLGDLAPLGSVELIDTDDGPRIVLWENTK